MLKYTTASLLQSSDSILASKWSRYYRLTQSEIFSQKSLRRRIIIYNNISIHSIESFLADDNFIPRDLPILTKLNYYDVNFYKLRLYTNSKNFNWSFNHDFYNFDFHSMSSLKKAVAKIKTVWVSKVTQLMLDPFRREFLILYRKPFKYQRRITKFILIYYRFKVLELMQQMEFKLLSILTRIKFSYSQESAKLLISKGFVRINGMQVNSISQYSDVSFSDTIQLVLSIRYLMYVKWIGHTHHFKFKRFYYLLNFWRIRSFRPFPKDSSYRIPYWVKHYVNFREARPIYTEISYFNFTVIILFLNYYNVFFYSYFVFHEAPFASVRGFNWRSLS